MLTEIFIQIKSSSERHEPQIFLCGLFALVFIILSCEKEFSNVGSSLLPSDTFVIDKQTASVEVEHKSLKSSVQITSLFSI